MDVGDLESRHSLTHIIQVESDHIHGFTWAHRKEFKSFPSLGLKLRQTCLGELRGWFNRCQITEKDSRALRETSHTCTHIRPYVHIHGEEVW